MSLILTSCTMGKQPERLLNKGPQYLRTRSTSGLFAQGKKSAAEMLAESKSQFYISRSTVDLSQQQDLAVSAGQGQRYGSNLKKAEPPRSKSQYDLSQIHLATVDDSSDENNNNTSDDSNDDCLDDSGLLTSHKTTKGGHIGPTPKADEVSGLYQTILHQEAPSFVSASLFRVNSAVKCSAKPPTKLTVLYSGSSVVHVGEQRQEVPKNESTGEEDKVNTLVPRRPMPVPRKSIVKPVPLPRTLSLRSPGFDSRNSSFKCLNKALSSSFSSQSLSSPSKYITPEITQLKTHSSVTDISVQRNRSLIEPQTFCYKTITSEGTGLDTEDSLLSPKNITTCDEKTHTENPQTPTAKPPVKAKPDIYVNKLFSRTVSVVENGPNVKLPDAKSPVSVSNVNSTVVGQDRRRNLHRKVSTSSCGSQIGIDSQVAKLDNSPTLVNSRSTSHTSSGQLHCRLEMSIDSVDQAVYESEISAFPSISMDTSYTQEEDRRSREITRSNSSLSGKFEQQSASPLSLSPTPHCSSVPRSYSDISCHLEGQHSRDSSTVSNHSRLSRASFGTDLENFFNQMGMEKGILEPLDRLKELQGNEIFDSMSSLDSHDAGSICSTYSRSDQEWSDSQSVDRNLQQTSIVERNARIIKWLCNVRKAKNPSQKSESAGASNV